MKLSVNTAFLRVQKRPSAYRIGIWLSIFCTLLQISLIVPCRAKHKLSGTVCLKCHADVPTHCTPHDRSEAVLCTPRGTCISPNQSAPSGTVATGSRPWGVHEFKTHPLGSAATAAHGRYFTADARCGVGQPGGGGMPVGAVPAPRPFIHPVINAMENIL